MALRIDRIPVILLTGFLGSGKTTLLRHLLGQPEAAGTAVLINELGAIGLDHQLAWGAADTTVVLENGCVCCSVQQDLAGALEDLFWKRLHRKVPRFERVVIETTGIADPARIVGLFGGTTLAAERYVLHGVVCTVDALLGEQQLQQHAECLSQAALADVLVVTKSDLAGDTELAALELALRQLNPGAALRRSSAGSAAVDVLALLGGGQGLVQSRAQHPDGAPGPLRGPLPSAGAHARLNSFVLRFAAFASHAALQSMLEAVLSQQGDQLLRVKGLVEVCGEARPTVVQAVGRRLFPFDRIPPAAQWAGPGFLVFITCDLSLEDLLRCEALAQARLAENPDDQRQS
jgi:G3E family GTPase